MNEVLSCCDCTHVEVISRDSPIKLADLYLCPKLIDADCVLGAKIWVFGKCWDGTDFSVKSRFQHCCLGSYGFTVPFQVPQFRFLLLDTTVSVQCFQGIILHFTHFGIGSVPFWFQFDFISGGTQSSGNGMLIDWNLKCSNCRYQNKKVSVLSEFSVLYQH